MVKAVAFTLLSLVAADCSASDQAALADPDVVGQKANDCGHAAFSLVGGFDHDKFNTCFTASAGVSSGCSECYAQSGEYSVKNCKLACISSWCSAGCLECTAGAQADLATCTGFPTGTAQPCDGEVSTQIAVQSAGTCSASDQAALSDPNVLGQKASDCGHAAFSLVGGFDHDKFNTCFTASAGVSSGCSECYAQSGEYSVKNCKLACISSWCSSGCLECTEGAKADLSTCTGFPAGSAEPCDGASAGTCSASDQAALADPDDVGQKANDCGHAAFSLVGGFDHDKFNTCFTASAGVSSGCSECYAQSGEYSVKNCKLACISSWCSAGCLECTAGAQADLSTCTGFPTGTAQPCDGEVSTQSAGTCSASDQAALADPDEVGQKANDCGHAAFSLVGGFDHDKFNTCFTASAGVSGGCSECYAQSGEYSVKNCKLACISSWCSAGCLECTAGAQTDLATCTGFPTGTAQPCDGAVTV